MRNSFRSPRLEQSASPLRWVISPTFFITLSPRLIQSLKFQTFSPQPPLSNRENAPRHFPGAVVSSFQSDDADHSKATLPSLISIDIDIDSSTFLGDSRLFIVHLRGSFDAADPKQWEPSSLREFLRDGQLTDREFRVYFLRIDANSTGHISWDSLVRYLIRDIGFCELQLGENSLNLIQKTGKVILTHEVQHREVVKDISICQTTGECVTLSADSIRFRNESDLSFRGCITEPGLLNSMVIFEASGQMAVATSSRRLFVSDLESAAVIKQMSRRECQSAIHVLKCPKVPLYNVLTSLIVAEFCDHDALQRLFLIVDNEGILEVFRFFGPSRRHFVDVRVERIGRKVAHTYRCYATSSLDGTPTFWECDLRKSDLSVFRTFPGDNSDSTTPSYPIC